MTVFELPGRRSRRRDWTKICVIGLRGVPGVMGGIESHCEQLYPRLKARRPDLDITIIGRRPYMPGGRQEFRGLEVIPLPASRNKYFEAISNTFVSVLYAGFVLRCGIVHIHGIGPALIGPLVRLLGMKLVVTHHGNDFEREKWNRLAKAVLRFGERCALFAADRLIVVSKSVADKLIHRQPNLKARVQHVPNGATNLAAAGGERDEDTILAQFGLERGRYVLAVGRLVPEKGFHTLIAAYLAGKADFKLVIAGRADHEDAYSRSLMQHARDGVVFTGFQTHAVLHALYCNASLFVLPSTHEGLPIAALEAARVGVPVLLSDIQANLDIGLPAANYFPVGDVSALKSKLYAHHGACAVDAAAIANRFNWDTVSNEVEQIYSDLMRATRS